MGLAEKQIEFTEMIAELILWINSHTDGYKCVLGEVERTKYQQEWNVANGKSKTKNSAHLYNLAADLRIFKNIKTNDHYELVYLTQTPQYKFAGEHWESMNEMNIWGGRFGDNPNTPQIEGWDGNHFQFTNIGTIIKELPKTVKI